MQKFYQTSLSNHENNATYWMVRSQVADRGMNTKLVVSRE